MSQHPEGFLAGAKAGQAEGERQPVPRGEQQQSPSFLQVQAVPGAIGRPSTRLTPQRRRSLDVLGLAVQRAQKAAVQATLEASRSTIGSALWCCSHPPAAIVWCVSLMLPPGYFQQAAVPALGSEEGVCLVKGRV